MIGRVFVDSDVILDVATGRTPFVDHSAPVLAAMENGRFLGFVSSNSVTNIYYVLRKIGTHEKAKRFIGSILTYLSVLPVRHATILDALASGFPDFEDAVQHRCALDNLCECIVTRNGHDYRTSVIPVYTPLEFLATFPA